MPATHTDLVIEQGATWAHGWAVTYNGDPVDDTWTVRSQVRKSVRATTVLHEFAASVNDDGSVVIAVDAEESTAWEWQSGKYDVEITNADETVTLRVAEGSVRVDPEVTRDDV